MLLLRVPTGERPTACHKGGGAANTKGRSSLLNCWQPVDFEPFDRLLPAICELDEGFVFEVTLCRANVEVAVNDEHLDGKRIEFEVLVDDVLESGPP